MINKKRKFSLKNEYQKSWDYLKDSKKFIWAVIGIFATFFLIGIFVPTPDYLSEKIFEFIKEILSKTEGMSQKQLISFIFFNNVQSSLFGMILGFFVGIFPAISTIINGYLLGFVSNLAIQNAGIGSLWRILPHGIFELPAIFISFGLGIRLGISVFNRKKLGNLEHNFISCLKAFILIIVPLLIIAAIIEGSLIFLGI